MTYYTLANADIVSVPSGSRAIRQSGEREGRKTAFFVLAGVLIAVLAVYIFAVNSIVGGTYELRALNKKQEELKSQNQLLEIQAAGVRAVQDIQSLAAPLNLVAVDKIEYINIEKSNSFALANQP